MLARSRSAAACELAQAKEKRKILSEVLKRADLNLLGFDLYRAHLNPLRKRCASLWAKYPNFKKEVITMYDKNKNYSLEELDTMLQEDWFSSP